MGGRYRGCGRRGCWFRALGFFLSFFFFFFLAVGDGKGREERGGEGESTNKPHDNTIDPVLHRQPRVRRAHDPLHHHLSAPAPPQPGQVPPAQTRVDEGARDAAEAATLGVVDGRPLAHGRALGGFHADALVGFALAGDGAVDGEDEDADPHGPDGAQQALGVRAGFGDVELEEKGWRFVVVGGRKGGGDFGDGEGGVG